MIEEVAKEQKVALVQRSYESKSSDGSGLKFALISLLQSEESLRKELRFIEGNKGFKAVVIDCNEMIVQNENDQRNNFSI